MKVGELMSDEHQIPQELIDRINELAKKKKAEGLTAEEQEEQARLRENYLALFRKSFRSRIEMLRVFDKSGKEVTPKKVRDIQRERGLRDD